MSEDVQLITPRERRPGPATPGMDRQQATSSERMWSGLVRTEPGMVSGWHHHGDHETVVYVVAGSMRMDFGPGGERSVDAGPGDFLVVPPHTVHRESNTSSDPSDVIVVRAGTGESTVNVDGPAPA